MRDLITALATSLTVEPVRRLLLNLLHFHRFKVFPPGFDVSQALRTCFGGLDFSLPNEELCNQLENNIALHFFSLLKGNMFLGSQTCPGTVYRVLDYNRIAGGTHSLLKVVELARRGINFRDLSEDAQRKLATYVSDELIVDRDLVMRGRFPFAWMTNHNLIGLPKSAPNRNAQHICQLLALTYSGSADEISLFLLQSPVDKAKASFRRPTPFDGFAGRFFKARTLRDTDTQISQSGYTLSLADLRAATPPVFRDSFDGAAEYVVHDFSVQRGASCQWLGFFDPNWVQVDADAVDQVLIGEADVRAQLTEALHLVTSLVRSGP